MNFLVLGCNGMAGHMISLYLKEKGYNVTGYARHVSYYVQTILGDVKDLALLKDVVYRGKYDYVINCIGLLNQYAEMNPAEAVFLNSYLPHYLCQITEGMDTCIMHMSTDCVFSGQKGQYTEHDLPDGISFYDRTKALGEIIDGKNITFRNSIVGPDIKKEGIGLLNWFLQEKNSVYGYTGAIWTGQTTLQLAKTMEAAAIARAHGLYNAVPEVSISKFELLGLFNKYIRKVPIEIIPNGKVNLDKSLVRTNFENFDYQIPDYKTMVMELGDWMRTHKEMYPQYEL